MREGQRCHQLRGLHQPQGGRGRFHIYPSQVRTESVSRGSRHLAGDAAPSHVLFFKEVPGPNGTLGDNSAAGAWSALLVPAPP